MALPCDERAREIARSFSPLLRGDAQSRRVDDAASAGPATFAVSRATARLLLRTCIMKPILVLYATREGHTRKIAEHVAATLRGRGLEAHLLDVGKLHATFSMDGYAASILAASVHLGHHEREMIAFVKRHREELDRAPTSFLSVSMSEATVEDPSRPDAVRARAAEEIAGVLDTFYRESGWHPKHVKAVAGALLFTQYGMIVRFVMKLISKHNAGPTDTSRDYVYTDWQALDRFVAALIDALPEAQGAAVGHAWAGST